MNTTACCRKRRTQPRCTLECAGMRQTAPELGTTWAETERLLLSHLIRAEQTRNGASGKPGAVHFRTPAELPQKLRQWEHEYNHRRLHLALQGRTPAERLCELRIAPEPVQTSHSSFMWTSSVTCEHGVRPDRLRATMLLISSRRKPRRRACAVNASKPSVSEPYSR
jgi:hypothetical protein